jgi:DNA-binding response OmpR family regulator
MGGKILVVDDDADFRMQLRLQLQHAGFEVVSADSVAEAQQVFEVSQPDLAIVDCMLENPDDGFVLCHIFKKARPHLPIIMVTSVTQKTRIDFEAVTSEERSWVKADLLLHKPVRLESLTSEIRRLLPAS